MSSQAGGPRRPHGLPLGPKPLSSLGWGPGGNVVEVKCPHGIGLCYEDPETGMLYRLPCSCNDPSIVVRRFRAIGPPAAGLECWLCEEPADLTDVLNMPWCDACWNTADSAGFKSQKTPEI